MPSPVPRRGTSRGSRCRPCRCRSRRHSPFRRGSSRSARPRRIDAGDHGANGQGRGDEAGEAVGVLEADGPADFEETGDNEVNPGHGIAPCGGPSRDGWGMQGRPCAHVLVPLARKVKRMAELPPWQRPRARPSRASTDAEQQEVKHGLARIRDAAAALSWRSGGAPLPVRRAHRRSRDHRVLHHRAGVARPAELPVARLRCGGASPARHRGTGLASTDLGRWVRQPTTLVDILILVTLFVAGRPCQPRLPARAEAVDAVAERFPVATAAQAAVSPVGGHRRARSSTSSPSSSSSPVSSSCSSPAKSGIEGYVDALYYTMTAVTTTGYGDIALPGTTGKLDLDRRHDCRHLGARQAGAGALPAEQGAENFPCPHCGLSRHDPDAVHCKACGRLLNIPDEDTTGSRSGDRSNRTYSLASPTPPGAITPSLGGSHDAIQHRAGDGAHRHRRLLHRRGICLDAGCRRDRRDRDAGHFQRELCAPL